MVSIIVPVYNGEKYITACVESLCGQTYKDLEIILVNDGSTDGTHIILDELKARDNRITVIHKENGGVSSARNRGIEEARGEYILFCDCDDVVDQEWCEILFNAIEKFPDSLPMCWIRWIFDDHNIEPWVDCIKSDYANGDLYHHRNKTDMHVFFDNIILYSPCNKIYKSSIIKQNNICFDIGKSRGEDAVFNFKYISYLDGKTVTVNKALYNYVRQNPNSLIHSSTLDGAKSVEYLYQNLKSLFCRINLYDKYFFNIFYQSYLEQYIRYFFVCLNRKNVSKFSRIKKCLNLVYLKGFRECAQKADKEKVSSKKIVKMLKLRPVLFLYGCIKIVLS